MNAKDKLIQDYDSFIKFVIKDMHLGYLYDEIYDLALIGFAQAVNTYDESKKIKATTYFYECIKNEILKGTKQYKIYKERYNPISLNQPLLEGAEEEIQDTIPCYEQYERNLYMDEILCVINRRLSFLDETQQEIFKHLYGLDGYKQMTGIELEKKYKTSKQNIYRIKKDIIRKLKHCTLPYMNNYYEGLYDEPGKEYKQSDFLKK